MCSQHGITFYLTVITGTHPVLLEGSRVRMKMLERSWKIQFRGVLGGLGSNSHRAFVILTFNFGLSVHSLL